MAPTYYCIDVLNAERKGHVYRNSKSHSTSHDIVAKFHNKRNDGTSSMDREGAKTTDGT